MLPPFVIKGTASRVIRIKECTEISNRRNKGFGLLMTIGDRQLRTCSPEGGAASCSNGMFVCNADNKPAFALQKIFQHVCYS